jgi:Mg-chelatase subunit ChlD
LDETIPKALPVGMVAVSIVFAILLAILLYLLVAKRMPNERPTGPSDHPETLTMGAVGDGEGDSPEEPSQQIDASADPTQGAAEATLPPADADQSTSDQDAPGGTNLTDTRSDVDEFLPIRPRETKRRSSAVALETDKTGKNPFDDASGDGDVVYVIDCSDSMDGDPLMRVQRSLCDAIQRLGGNRKFAVIFFNSAPVLGPISHRLTTASARTKREAVNWIQGVQPGGGTDPSDALFLALRLRPDRIVVLSDGEFSPDVVALVTQVNHRAKPPIRIDCIGLTEDVKTLRDLAHQNASGVYYQAR